MDKYCCYFDLFDTSLYITSYYEYCSMNDCSKKQTQKKNSNIKALSLILILSLFQYFCIVDLSVS